MSTINSGATINLVIDTYTKAQSNSLVAGLASTTSMKAAITTQATSSYLDAQTYAKTAIANAAITNSGAGLDLLTTASCGA